MYKIYINNTISKKEFDLETNELVDRDPSVILTEEQALKDAKTVEISALVDHYKAAQQNQLSNGGAGPVADFEIMKIVNEYGGEFEVLFKII